MTKQLPSTIAPSERKEPRISKRIRQAVALIASGKVATQKAAAEAVGLSEEHLCRMLKRSTIRVFYEREVRETIARGQMRAAARLIQLLDAQSEHVSFDAARHLLALHGIAPPTAPMVAVNINIQPGYVIDLRGDDPDEQDKPLLLPPSV